MGNKAEPALRAGAKSENDKIAKRCEELLVAFAPGQSGGSGGGIVKSGPFPRRMLFIHISKYMYLNPLTAGLAGIDRSKAAANHLAFQWRVPQDKDNNQLFILSDTAKPDPPIPMKNVVVGAYEKFFETSRGQDRIVVYFGGHAVEKDGKVYLAPIEGELEDANSLIPLAEFYAKLNACKATQKVVIWDVCRFNAVRGHERPGSAPMTETLAKALAAAPAGVEVVATCQPGENRRWSSIDSRSQQRHLRRQHVPRSPQVAPAPVGVKAPTAADPIPVAEWTQAVGKRMTELTALGNSSVRSRL